MSDKGSSDNIARITAIASLCIAAVAIVVPYVQQRSQFNALQAEELNLRVSPEIDGPVRLLAHDFGSLGRVVQVPWELTLSNTGNRKLSIVQYDVSMGPYPGAQFYSGIDGGMMGQDGEAVDLPIVLEPGESHFLAIYVGLLVPRSVYAALSSSNNRKSATTISEATKVLGKLGLDLYGNRINFTEFPDGTYIATIDMQEQNAPTFWFRLTTGQGDVFIGSANHYSNPASLMSMEPNWASGSPFPPSCCSSEDRGPKLAG